MSFGKPLVLAALLLALLSPDLTPLQDAGNWTEVLVRQEEQKTLPFGDVWEQYCRVCGAPADGEWLAEVKTYEQEILRKRG